MRNAPATGSATRRTTDMARHSASVDRMVRLELLRARRARARGAGAGHRRGGAHADAKQHGQVHLAQPGQGQYLAAVLAGVRAGTALSLRQLDAVGHGDGARRPALAPARWPAWRWWAGRHTGSGSPRARSARPTEPGRQAGGRRRPRHGYSPSVSHMASTRRLTASSMCMGVPHSRLVSPGHLLVASSPILPPRPDTGEAKSR